jgi:hypothetical protein
VVRQVVLAIAALLSLLPTCPRLLAGQQHLGAPSQKPAAPQQLPHVVMRVRAVRPDRIGIGETLYLDIDSLSEAVKRDRVDPHDFVLYLNGLPLWNVHGRLVNPTSGTLAFRLEDADSSRDAWVSLLGSPKSLLRHGIAVGAGHGQEQELAPAEDIPPYLTLTIVQVSHLVIAAVLLVGLLVGFVVLARRSNIVCDPSPPFPPPKEKKPFSLSRLQMAVRFFLVLGAFIFLNLVTHSVDTLNQQALILIGIGTGTALGAALVDNSKRADRNSRLDELEPSAAALEAEIEELRKAGPQEPIDPKSGLYTAAALPPVQLAEKQAKLAAMTREIEEIKLERTSPVSEGFFQDILSDSGGVSFHRFQMMSWTIVLALVFIYSVWERLAMPEFSVLLLSLMGISAGTYLGFKVPEK